MKKLLIIILMTFILSSCSTTASDDETRYNIDLNNIKDRTVAADEIFIGKIIEKVDTYFYNENDIAIGYKQPLTHYKVEIIYSIKGSKVGTVLDLFIYAGINQDGELEGNPDFVELPKINDVFLIYSPYVSNTGLKYDSRLIAGAIYNFGLLNQFLPLHAYSEQSDIKDQNNDIKEIISEAEKAVKEFEKLSIEDLYDD